MTENEAIERIRTGICCEKGTARYCTDACMYGKEKCAYSMAIKALEEIQQYRAIGTVEECQEVMEKQKPFKLRKARLLIGIGRCKCGAEFLNTETNYCGNCGQKLDWR